MKIFLAGGGTGGPTTPLLAVAEALNKLDERLEFFLVGNTPKLDRRLLASVKFPITYLAIPAGKWRRYFSFKNIIDVFKISLGFLKSLYLIKRYQPHLIFGAGSYVQVPLVWAGFLMKVATVVHQPDFNVLLSTRLTAPFAKAVTTAFQATARELPSYSGIFRKVHQSKIFWAGNPVRTEFLKGSVARGRNVFALKDNLPTVLVTGGATGSTRLNQVLLEALPELDRYVQIIHVTGGRAAPLPPELLEHYHPVEFLTEDLKHAYAAADLVICRGGMSTISEIAHLQKVAIVVPLPNSPQEDNVRLLAHLRCAVGVFEEFLTPELLVKLVRKILWSPEVQQTLKQNIKHFLPPGAADRLAKLLLKILSEQQK